MVSLLVDSASNCTDAHLNKDQYGETDVHYLIDFDTAWMGEEPEAYAKECELVRRESKHLSDEEYKVERLKVGFMGCFFGKNFFGSYRNLVLYRVNLLSICGSFWTRLKAEILGNLVVFLNFGKVWVNFA